MFENDGIYWVLLFCLSIYCFICIKNLLSSSFFVVLYMNKEIIIDIEWCVV